jgi:hypothetical protein
LSASALPGQSNALTSTGIITARRSERLLSGSLGTALGPFGFGLMRTSTRAKS